MTRTVAQRWVTACLVATLLCGLLSAEDASPKKKPPASPDKKEQPAGEESPEPAINPWHRPEGSIVGKSARYYLWYEEGTWSLRACAQTGRKFQGTIKVIGGGRIKAVLPVGVDARKKDAWVVNADRNELKFRFQTGNKSDGLDIKVEGDSAQLEFHLQTASGKTPASAIYIGKSEQHPSKSPFQLPLSPPPPAKIESEKKK